MPAATDISPAVIPATFSDLTQHLEKWFYRPDLEAVEVVLSTVIAHHTSQAEPVWLFVLGPSGSGKTAICIQSVSKTPRSRIMGAMTPHTLVSFYSGKTSGVLTEVGKSGVLLFKDFTTILTMRDEPRAEIIGQLREVFDGKWQRDSGSGGFGWEGKVTCIAACTPALERAWAAVREMGERFLTVRWPRIGGKALALAAGRQQGFEREIAERTAALGAGVVKNAGLTLPEMLEEQVVQISNLAEIVATLRPHVPRAKGNEIVEVPGAEEPGRIHKGLSLIVRGHAAMCRKSQVDDDDVRLARRVSRDSIPLRRFTVLREMQEGKSVSAVALANSSDIPQSTVRWNLEELEALRAVRRVPKGFSQDEWEWQVTDNFAELNRAAGFERGILR